MNLKEFVKNGYLDVRAGDTIVNLSLGTIVVQHVARTAPNSTFVHYGQFIIAIDGIDETRFTESGDTLVRTSLQEHLQVLIERSTVEPSFICLRDGEKLSDKDIKMLQNETELVFNYDGL
jgi:hypothetical protein